MTDWTEKYRPTTLSEVRGNDTARDQLREWAESWDEDRRAVIVHGAPGVGKTSAAHALAEDMGWDVMELNASDSRTGDEIDRLAGGAAMNQSLRTIDYEGGDSGDGGGRDPESGRQLLILDEADNVHGNADRGGTRAITRLVKEAGQPVVLIANEFYDMSQGLRDACETIEFRDVSPRSIVPVLRDVCRKEGIEYESDALEAIAERNRGDLRGAVNDLQAVAEGSRVLREEDVVTGSRDKERGIFEYLDTVIKEADAQEALEASYDVDETPDDLINWIEDNVPKDYAGAELADAYEHLADADVWLGRTRATQQYRFWRYATDNMTAGVAASRRESKGGWTRYGPPSFWSKLGRSKGTRDKRDYVARKVAEAEGMSVATARRSVLPYLSAMTAYCKPRELTVAMVARYELDVEHVAFVTGSGESTNKVQSIVEEAEELREREAVEHSGDAFLPGETLGGAGEDRADGDGADADAGEDGSGEPDAGGQATLTDATGSEEEDDAGAETDPADRADAAGEDDQQSGLEDFV
jgi:replication factor C large subunit